MRRGVVFIVGLLVVFFIYSCEKSFELRFTNFYREPMDSLIVGEGKLVFLNVDPEQTTSYKKISKGSYKLFFITRTKKRILSSITIPGDGPSKYTVQIDGIEQVALLPD